MKKLTMLILGTCLVGTLLVGCSSNGDEGKTTKEATTSTTDSNHAADEKKETFSVDKIAVTYVKSPLNVPSIVEKDKGFFSKAFEEYNLPVEYSELTTGPEQTQALASGDIQFLNAVGATSVILSAANGADIKILSTYSRSPKAFMLFSADDSIKSPKDLKGKKVAGPKGTILHELLLAYLETEGMTEADIEFVAMGIPESQAALVGKSVDAALLAGPTAYNMIKDGYHVVTDGEGLTDATIVTATSNEFYNKNPELVKRFIEAQKLIADFMESNYDEVMELTAKEVELDVEAVKEMYNMYDFNTEITKSDIDAMKKTADFMKKNNMIETTVNIEDLILTVE